MEDSARRRQIEAAAEKLKAYIDYSPSTGRFFSTKSKKVLDSKDVHGYIRFYAGGRVWRAHRVAFYFVHGKFPAIVDHINGIRDDNRIENLREGKNRSFALQRST